MANKKVPTQGGSARGHSNMEHGLHTAEIKESARQARRREDGGAADEQLDGTEPSTESLGELLHRRLAHQKARKPVLTNRGSETLYLSNGKALKPGESTELDPDVTMRTAEGATTVSWSDE